jgi:O-antigen ligase
MGFWGLIALQFVMPSNLIYDVWFYLGIAVPLVIGLWYQPQAWHVLPPSSLPYLLGALFTYTILHAWGLTEDAQGAMDTTRHTISTVCFIVAASLCLARSDKSQLDWLIQRLLGLLILTGTASIIWHVATAPLNRLQAFGQNDHPILGASVYATIALLSTYLLHPAHAAPPRIRWLCYGALGITLVLILFTQSRGPLLAYGGSAALALWLLGWYRLLAAGTVLALLTAGDFALYYSQNWHLLPLSFLYEAVIDLAQRDSHRLAIWTLALELISQRPWLGHGMQAPFPYGFGGVNPHNLFLSAFYYTGIAGFILLCMSTLCALARALRQRQTPYGATCTVLMLHAILAMVTDQGQYVNSPAPIWTIFWLPVSMVIALRSR